MKSILLASLALIGSLTFASSPEFKTLAVSRVSNATFQFTVFSPRPGLVSFKNYEATRGFPRVGGDLVEAIRWYYSPVSFADVTPESPYVEVWMNMNTIAIPPVGIGGLQSGDRYYFKVGLATREGDLVYFTNDYETEMARNSVVVD